MRMDILTARGFPNVAECNGDSAELKNYEFYVPRNVKRNVFLNHTCLFVDQRKRPVGQYSL